jgi:hypothetical protein
MGLMDEYIEVDTIGVVPMWQRVENLKCAALIGMGVFGEALFTLLHFA